VFQGDSFASIDLLLRFLDGRLKAPAILFIEVVMIVHDEQAELGLIGQIDRILDDDPAATNPRAQRQSHDRYGTTG
jgi:hypothetical protein